MSHLATCLRCGTPLTAGNAQAVDPSVCLGCLQTAPVPAPAAEPAPLRAPWLYGGAVAVAALAAVFVLAALPRAQKPTEDDEGEEITDLFPVIPKPPAALPSVAPEPVRLREDDPPAPVRVAPLTNLPTLARARELEPERLGPPEVERPPQGNPAGKGHKRRNHATEADLLRELATAEEVGLGPAGASVLRTYASHVARNKDLAGSKGAADSSAVLQLRPDLAVLPLRDGPSCTLAPRAAGELQTLSRKMRVYLNTLSPAGLDGRRRSTALLRDQFHEDKRGKKLEWLRPEAVPTINQMLMAEEAELRKLLVEVLAEIKGKAATVALARRAAFDLAPEVRAAALDALKARPADDWRPVLLGALRYPWPAPADFAAEALVGLGDRDAIPDLVALLKMPPAGRPFSTKDGRHRVREVVRIHHLNNCLLCHPPAIRGDEPVLGVDPVQNIPTTVVTSNPALLRSLQQIGGGSGGHDYGNRSSGFSGQTGVVNGQRVGVVNVAVPLLVRADITFLRQDFSVSLPGTGPRQAVPPAALLAQARGTQLQPVVRFDFVVRTRTLKPAERKKWEENSPAGDPQRDAVLFALRELSGRDEGEATEAWVKAYPHAEADLRSRKLADAVVHASMVDRAILIARHRDARGVEHTWALARAVPRLSGTEKESARAALAARLAKADAAGLREHLKDSDAEVRRAAIRACGEKGDRDLAADLVALLDADPTTAGLARAALKKLTGRDLNDADWRAGVARR